MLNKIKTIWELAKYTLYGGKEGVGYEQVFVSKKLGIIYEVISKLHESENLNSRNISYNLKSNVILKNAVLSIFYFYSDDSEEIRIKVKTELLDLVSRYKGL